MCTPLRFFVVVTFLALLAALLAAQILGSRDSDWPKNDWHPPKNECGFVPEANYVLMANLIVFQ